jgi:hypothetical protein
LESFVAKYCQLHEEMTEQEVNGILSDYASRGAFPMGTDINGQQDKPFQRKCVSVKKLDNKPGANEVGADLQDGLGPPSDQNFSVPLTRWLNCLTALST